MPSSTSSLVMQRPDAPLIWIERLSAAPSNQPPRRERKRVIPRLGEIDRLRAQVFRQYEVMEIEERFELRRKALRHQKVPDADRAARDLVFVRGPDTAAGGADFCGALRRFTRDV